MRIIRTGALPIICGAVSFACVTAPALAQESPRDVIAAQIRLQGFACDRPTAADRDQSLSKPDEAVWVLKCENATYRVRLIPNMAARVEKL